MSGCRGRVVSVHRIPSDHADNVRLLELIDDEAIRVATRMAAASEDIRVALQEVWDIAQRAVGYDGWEGPKPSRRNPFTRSAIDDWRHARRQLGNTSTPF